LRFQIPASAVEPAPVHEDGLHLDHRDPHCVAGVEVGILKGTPLARAGGHDRPRLIVPLRIPVGAQVERIPAHALMHPLVLGPRQAVVVGVVLPITVPVTVSPLLADRRRGAVEAGIVPLSPILSPHIPIVSPLDRPVGRHVHLVGRQRPVAILRRHARAAGIFVNEAPAVLGLAAGRGFVGVRYGISTRAGGCVAAGDVPLSLIEVPTRLGHRRAAEQPLEGPLEGPQHPPAHADPVVADVARVGISQVKVHGQIDARRPKAFRQPRAGRPAGDGEIGRAREAHGPLEGHQPAREGANLDAMRRDAGPSVDVITPVPTLAAMAVTLQGDAVSSDDRHAGRLVVCGGRAGVAFWRATLLEGLA